ncbi:hypothetical protein BLNAU_13492 [Blattamonas nauphoetae]|uniref:RING-type domain-containing protein n=1 Tax=Blattamonas nauphoetae TaxID=2049346 RepID=A0ABQ9XGM6_9EUKA|nr:hypothetical protein BLNAU_13492 [Blattamonas nauphoetae]
MSLFILPFVVFDVCVTVADIPNPRTDPLHSIPLSRIDDFRRLYPTPNSIPPSSISDQSGYLNIRDFVNLNRELEKLKKSKGINFMICLVRSITSNEPAHSFSNKLYQKFGLADNKEPSLLITVAINDEKMTTSTGPELASVMTTKQLEQVVSDMRLPLNDYRFANAISVAIADINKISGQTDTPTGSFLLWMANHMGLIVLCLLAVAVLSAVAVIQIKKMLYQRRQKRFSNELLSQQKESEEHPHHPPIFAETCAICLEPFPKEYIAALRRYKEAMGLSPPPPPSHSTQSEPNAPSPAVRINVTPKGPNDQSGGGRGEIATEMGEYPEVPDGSALPPLNSSSSPFHPPPPPHPSHTHPSAPPPDSYPAELPSPLQASAPPAAANEHVSSTPSGPVFPHAEKLETLPVCGHQFHRKCLDDWLKIHNRCPLCNADNPRNIPEASLSSSVSGRSSATQAEQASAEEQPRDAPHPTDHPIRNFLSNARRFLGPLAMLAGTLFLQPRRRPAAQMRRVNPSALSPQDIQFLIQRMSHPAKCVSFNQDRMTLALFVLVAVSQAREYFYTIKKTDAGATVTNGKGKDDDVIARFEDTIKKQGYTRFEITTKNTQTTSAAYLMGFGEGYILQKQIANHYGNVMEYVEKNIFKTEETKTKVVEFFKQNLEYIKEQCKTTPDSPYWKTVTKFIDMNRGIAEGFNAATKKTDRTELDFYIYQSIDTIREITDWLTGAEVPSVQELIQYQTGTVLARLAKKSADIIVGHNTYGTYNALNRVEKRYNFFEPHLYKIGGSSQPGMIFPVSSANVINSKYVVAAVTMVPTVKSELPTTHANYVPGWLALAVSTYLTNDPTYEKEKVTRERFSSAFDVALAMPSYHQVLIVDYSKFTRKADPEAECVSIFENGPAASHTEDVTKGLKDNTKMNVLLLNVPCLEPIKVSMKTAEFLAAAPENKFYFDPVESQRAKGAHKWGVQIATQGSMQNVLRYNEYYAKDALNPVTGQQDPCAAIAPRCDHRNATHKLTAMPFGVVDSTVVQSYMIQRHNSFHLMGPITGTYEGRYDGKVTNDTKTNLPTVNMTAIVEKFKLKADGIAVFPNTKNWNMMAWIREGQQPIIVMNIVFIVLSSIGIVILCCSVTFYMLKKKKKSKDNESINPTIQDKK